MPKLTFSEPQIAIAIVFVVIALALTTLFVAVAVAARRDEPFEEVKTVGYRIRPWWLAILVLVLSAGLAFSFVHLPYPSRAAGPARTVNVGGGQFYWSVSPQTVPAGSHVRFVVTSVDVNHSLGLYGPKGDLIGVVQAMPGYRNKLDLTLDDPGSYTFVCMEFCGVGHHRMVRPFRVTGSAS